MSAADVGGSDAPDAPVVACWEGRIAAVGPRAARRGGARGRGLPARPVRPARCRRRRGHARPGRPAHAPAVRRLARGRAGSSASAGAGYLEILAAGGGILSTVAATRAASTETLLAHGRRWLDEMLGHGVTTIEAKSGYGLDLETEIRLIEVAYRLGARGPDRRRPDLPRRARRPARVPRPGRTATEAYVRSVIEEQLPGVAAHGRARFCDVFCEKGVFSADQSRRILEAAAGLRARAAAARRRARPVRRRGAGRRAGGRVGRPPRDAVRRPASPRSPRPPRTTGRSSRPPAGDDLVPDEGPPRSGPDVHRRGHAGRASARTSTRAPRRRRACRWR